MVQLTVDTFKKPSSILIPGIIILFSGWFWIYPKKIAQGWDATPAHWPYYYLRADAISYIEKNNIGIENIGSYFPNVRSLKLTNAKKLEGGFHLRDTDTDTYILYSNVFNESDDTIDELFTSGNWTREKIWEKRNVKFILFKKRIIND